MSDHVPFPAPPPPAGTLSGGRHLLPLRVYYEDTDFSGVVYHANYLRFLERGRTEFIRALGIDQRALFAENGLAFVVRSLSIDYLLPALMDDLLLVETKLDTLGAASMQLGQRLTRAGTVLTTATVGVVCIRGARPVRLPEALRRAMSHSP